MEKIKKENPNAHEYLSKKDPKSWSRAFREGVYCEVVENNFTDQSKFEVRKGYDAFTVDKAANTCSFRMTEMFSQAYTQFMKPVEGRPKKKRIRASRESNSSTKISRAEIPMTCCNYGQPGHNKKGCKNKTIPRTPKFKEKADRPKKIVASENTNVVDDEDLPRGSKSSKGRLVPAERLGRIERWLGVYAVSLEPIEDTQPFQRSHVAINFNQNDARVHSLGASASPPIARQSLREPAAQESPTIQEPPPGQP
ncbi:hypothetical protein Tco_1214684 [Tanacetum coccineum]